MAGKTLALLVCLVVTMETAVSDAPVKNKLTDKQRQDLIIDMLQKVKPLEKHETSGTADDHSISLSSGTVERANKTPLPNLHSSVVDSKGRDKKVKRKKNLAVGNNNTMRKKKRTRSLVAKTVVKTKLTEKQRQDLIIEMLQKVKPLEKHDNSETSLSSGTVERTNKTRWSKLPSSVGPNTRGKVVKGKKDVAVVRKGFTIRKIVRRKKLPGAKQTGKPVKPSKGINFRLLKLKRRRQNLMKQRAKLRNKTVRKPTFRRLSKAERQNILQAKKNARKTLTRNTKPITSVASTREIIKLLSTRYKNGSGPVISTDTIRKHVFRNAGKRQRTTANTNISLKANRKHTGKVQLECDKPAVKTNRPKLPQLSNATLKRFNMKLRLKKNRIALLRKKWSRRKAIIRRLRQMRLNRRGNVRKGKGKSQKKNKPSKKDKGFPQSSKPLLKPSKQASLGKDTAGTRLRKGTAGTSQNKGTAGTSQNKGTAGANRSKGTAGASQGKGTAGHNTQVNQNVAKENSKVIGQLGPDSVKRKTKISGKRRRRLLVIPKSLVRKHKQHSRNIKKNISITKKTDKSSTLSKKSKKTTKGIDKRILDTETNPYMRRRKNKVDNKKNKTDRKATRRQARNNQRDRRRIKKILKNKTKPLPNTTTTHLEVKTLS